MTATMYFIVALGGALLGIGSFNVLPLMLATLLLAGIVVETGIVAGLSFGWIVACSLAAVASLQIAYLISSAATEYSVLPIKLPHRISAAPRLLELVRLAIGQELKVAFDLPQDLAPPPRILALMQRLDHA